MFGREATKILDYVECFPNGAGKGKKMTAECAAAGLEGFPTWFINGKVVPCSFDALTKKDMMCSFSRYCYVETYFLACNASTSVFV